MVNEGFVSDHICNSKFYRHCSCVFKDVKNIEKLNALVQGLLLTSASLLKYISRSISDDGLVDNYRVTENLERKREGRKVKLKAKEEKLIVDGSIDSRESGSDENEDDEDDEEDEDEDMDEDDISKWPLEDKEKLFILVSKTLYVHFPLYAVPKHSLHQTRLDDLGQKEAALVSSYCDINDPEVPILLLRNITFFCEQDVMDLFIAIFLKASPSALPLSLAHAIIAVIHHLKYGLNVNTLLAKLVSLRTCVINYLCKVLIRLFMMFPF